MNAETPKRPTILTDEMKQRAARQVAETLARFHHITESEVDDATRDISRVGRRGMDGYELAKALDDRCHWDCNRDMLDELDYWSSAASAEIKAAQQRWADENKIEPPFPVGTRVIARWGGEDHAGTIDEISKHSVAQYLVKRDGETSRSWMGVNFEDVRPEQVNAPA